MTSILITKETQDIAKKEIIICEEEDVYDIFDGRYYMFLYDNETAYGCLDGGMAEIVKEDGSCIEMEIISNIWKC